MCASVDDVHVLCRPERVKVIYGTLAECPFRVGASVCTKERRGCGTVEGIKVLGTPIGSAQFTWERLQTRIFEEQRLWDAILRVPDL